jgi:S-DNA-T family DNA segregation ATPase FtsK/SpoIIIE
MAKKKPTKEEKSKKDKKRVGGLRDEALQGVIAVAAFVVAIFTMLAAWGKAGPAGTYTYGGMHYLFGVGYYLLPLILIVLGIAFLKSIHQRFDVLKLIGSLLFLLSSLGLIDIAETSKGGIIGTWVSYPFVTLFATTASVVFLSAILIVSLIVAFNAEIDFAGFFSSMRWKRDEEDQEEVDGEDEAFVVTPPIEEEPQAKEPKPKDVPKKVKEEKVRIAPAEENSFIKPMPRKSDKAYVPPPLELLERDHGTPGVGDVKGNANIIKRTLMNFGIDVEMDEVSIGPSVTRYALKPAEGVKLSKIVALQNDLALALAAHPLRIEAPIPGKSLVGIEVPNSTKTTVGLGTLLSSEEFRTSDKPLLLALGRGISGKSHFANLGKMPHALIAGTTGSGKSVSIHMIVTSLLYRNSPNELKFIMIDPKRVELTLYKGIPHLLTPVITDAKKAILALKWAAKEMDRRYDVLESHKVRDIESYHKKIAADAGKKMKEGEEAPDTMPFIVIIIDELADIMQTYPRELESAIVRLAQMSRAVGIHLMLSTQRPSVNVITGLIKANIPSRMAFQVSSQVDSRTILDTIGAEKLLGAGDMLYLSGEMSKPTRIQSAFISEKEVKDVVKFLIANAADDIPSELDLTEAAVAGKNVLFDSAVDSEGDDDELYEQAKQFVTEAGKASTSYIQRKLRVGYSRAARLMDLLEERGVIGAADGAKPREVMGSSSAESDAPAEETIEENS